MKLENGLLRDLFVTFGRVFDLAKLDLITAIIGQYATINVSTVRSKVYCVLMSVNQSLDTLSSVINSLQRLLRGFMALARYKTNLQTQRKLQ